MNASIQFFGVAGYKIVTGDGVCVVIDPFLDSNPFSPVKTPDLGQVDLLLLTHNAFDHFGDAPAIIEKYGCDVICAVDVMHNLMHFHGIKRERILPTIWGMSMRARGVDVHPVESHHWSFAIHNGETILSGPAMGFIVEVNDETRIYHPGDTALFSDMKLIGEKHKPTIGLMHVTLPEGEGVSLPRQESYMSGELTPAEALMASEWLGLKEVLVSHYVDEKCPDVVEFVRLVKANEEVGGYAPRTTVLAPGDVYAIEPSPQYSTTE